MKTIKTLIRKELYHFFKSPIAWVFALVFILLNNFFYFNNLFLTDQASMRSYFGSMPLIMLFFISVVMMASFSNEKKSGTLEVLLSLPIKKSEIVLAKLLSFLVFFSFVLFFTFSIPLTLFSIGNPDTGPIITGYIGMLLLSLFYASVGLFVSCLFDEQIVVALITGLSLFALVMIGQDFVLERVPYSLQLVFSFLSPNGHFTNFTRGIITLADVFYYLSITAFLLYLTIKKLNFSHED